MENDNFIKNFKKQMGKALEEVAEEVFKETMQQRPMMAIANVMELKPIATSKLAGVEIADRDYAEWGKRYFTFEEALTVELKLTGWRLPTRSEWALICEEFGQKDGRLDGNTLSSRLKLERNGWYDFDDEETHGSTRYYWSSTPSSNGTLAYALNFNASGVNPSNYSSRYVGFSLRLVRDVKEEE